MFRAKRTVLFKLQNCYANCVFNILKKFVLHSDVFTAVEMILKKFKNNYEYYH